MINQYPLPVNTNESYHRWKLYKSSNFVPDESQQYLMDIVQEALTAGLFYTDDIYEYVVEKIHEILPEDYQTRQSNEVKHGVFGMEVYYADHAVQSKMKWQKEIDTQKRLDLTEGKILGTMKFNCFTVHQVKIEYISDQYVGDYTIECSGIRGGKQVKFNTSAIAIENALTAWQNKRKKSA